jgi:hypothetical protein
MRQCVRIMTVLVTAVVWIGGSANSSPAAPAVKLVVLNPRGEISPPPIFAPRTRITDLSDKKIGIYWNGKAGGNYFWNIIERLVKEKLPAATILRYDGAYEISNPLATKMAAEVDAFFYGVGD